MSIYIKVNNTEYPATVNGDRADRTWDNRESKSITLEMSHAEALELFVDGLAWSIVFQGDSYLDTETGETVTPEAEEYDNSDFCVAGDITDHRDGTVTVKMGKYTNEELLLMEVLA